MIPSVRDTKLHLYLLVSLTAVFIWSFIDCFDFLIWVLDAAPAVIGVGILIAVYRRFRFTQLVYILIWIHAIVLLIGAHYSYSRVPLFSWLRDTLDLSRNHYDRLGHLFQGFVPALIAREVLLRKSPLKKGGWLISIVIFFCLGISALYELFEWLVAVAGGDLTVDFLATQGDVWDTQKDMALCFIGAVISIVTLRRLHDKQIKTKIFS